MTKAPTQLTAAITRVPLGQLAIDKVNVRKVGRGAEPSYVASIRKKGVIVPLIVRAGKDGFTIVDGGKRLDSLKWMAANDEKAAGVLVGQDYAVPVQLRDESDADATETSLVTSIMRAAVHPADRFTAFAGIISDGGTPEEIAGNYAMSVKEVRQVLALGALAPAVLDAWRAGNIDADGAQAFTIAGNHKEQVALLARLAKQQRDGKLSTYSIRQAATNRGAKVSHLVSFVGVDAYRAAGGKVDEDLFGNSHVAHDAKLANKLATEKLQAECDKLIAEGWSWAAIADDLPNGAKYSWGTLGYREAKFTPEQTKRRKQIDKKIEELSEGEFSDAEDALEHEKQEIEAAADALKYSKADKAKSGCIVDINGGKLEVRFGILKPGAKKDAAGKGEKTKPDKSKSPRGADAGFLSQAITMRLSEQLTTAIANVLQAPAADHKEAADEIVSVGLVTMLAGFRAHTSVVAVSERGLATRRGRREDKGFDFVEAFEQMSAATPGDLLARLAAVAGAALDFESFNSKELPLDRPEVLAIINALPGEVVVPALLKAFDAKDYFNSVSGKLVAEALAEMGQPVPAKAKKPDLVLIACNCQEIDGWLPKPLRVPQYTGPSARQKAEKAGKAVKTAKGAVKGRAAGKAPAKGKPRKGA
jgi:ParB family chromosome partitioning protein